MNHRMRWWAAGPALVILFVALFDVAFTGPRVSVRWREGVAPADRMALERQYDLRNGEPDKGSVSTWQYELGNRSRDNIGAIVNDPAAADTHYLDRDALTAPRPTIRVMFHPSWYPLSDLLRRPSELLQLHQSLWLLLAGGALLWAAGALGVQGRRGVGIVAGGPYNSGILAGGTTFNYAKAPPEVVARARALDTVCRRHRIALPAAALQFILAHPLVVSVIPGGQNVTETRQNLAVLDAPIPAALWQELKSEGLLHAQAPVPV